MTEIKYWVAFNRIPHLGTARFRQLQEHFGSLEDAWTAAERTLRAAGLDSRAVSEVIANRGSISPDHEAELLVQAGVRAITWSDEEYPDRLKEIDDPPPVLYLKGEILPDDWRSIAIVGTRSATPYGKQATSTLTRDLVASGITVVSGLARGIDGVSHHEVIRSGGRTIAVMACGLDIIYPPEHASLAASISQQGALVSEHPLGVKPRSQQFPRRNRIMSGMTLGTLVIEAGEGSGAVRTVQHALEQGREVFCVPGSIFSPKSKMTNLLIQQGAKLVLTHEDVLQELNLSSIQRQLTMTAVIDPPEGDERSIWEQVSLEPLHIDEIRWRCQLPIALVSSTLAMMELKGLVRHVGGMNYVRA